MRTTATSILVLFLALWEAYAMQVDIYAHKDKFGQSLNMDISERECTNVPNPWRNVTMSVDTHGSCMQFYDGKSCTGRIAVIQPFHTVHQMDLSLINFHNVIQSVSPCGAKVPTGRYVIQSAVDASILTVSKYENQFATVHTLPPRAFIPKAQQWEIIEKVPTEYDIEPRIHQTNAPVTYDGEAMKRGSFIRKKWKIESVGRGRYVFKSEWSGKCLYKTRFRTIEEHDCRAWSPNQEWVLRPLLTAKPNPPLPPALNEEAKYHVPSKIVEEYLEQQKFVREQQDINGDYKGNTYKITNKRKKPPRIDDSFRSRKQDLGEPPQPKVFYSRSQPNFLRPQPQYSRYSLPSREVMYMEGGYPVYKKVEVEDPVFPDFLLHAVQRNEPPPEPEKYKPAPYLVTRRPSGPLPTGHPNFVPRIRKYDGRIKIPITNKPVIVKPVESEEDEEDDEDDKKDALPDTTEESVYEAFLRDKEEREQNGNESAESEEEDEDDQERDAPEEEEEEEEEVNTAQDEKRKKEEKEIEQDSEEDPAQSVAGFMKLLFKGISNKMQDEDRAKEEMINTFER